MGNSVNLVQGGGTCRIDGISVHDADFLYQKLSYVNRSIRQLNKNRRYKEPDTFSAYDIVAASFPFGLRERVTTLLAYRGTHVEYFKRNIATIADYIPGDRVNWLALRDYQDEAASSIVSVDCRQETGHISVPTGGGKTYIIGQLAAMSPMGLLIIVPSKEILEQIYDLIDSVFPGMHPIRLGGGKDILSDAPIMVSTHQTLGARIKESDPFLMEFLLSVKTVITDECHHSPCDNIMAVLNNCLQLVGSFGLSATPYRTDGLDIMMEGAVGPLRYNIPPRYLKDRGFLCGGRVLMCGTPEPKLPKDYKMFATVYKHLLSKYEPRNKMVVNSCKSAVSMGIKTICFMKYREHAEEIYDRIRNLPGVRLITGKTKKTERANIFEQLREGTVTLIVATIGKEGLDIPVISGVVLAGGGSDVSQMVGRALRPAEGKSGAMIWDFYDAQHFMLESQSKRRLKWYKDADIFEVVRF